MPIEKRCKFRITGRSLHKQKNSRNNFHSIVNNISIDTIGDSWNSSQKKIFTQAVRIIISIKLYWLFFQLVYLVVLTVDFSFECGTDYVTE